MLYWLYDIPTLLTVALFAGISTDLSADDDGVGAEGLSGQRVLLGDRAVGVEPVDEGAGCGKFDLHHLIGEAGRGP